MQKNIKRVLLPKYGFNRNTPSAVVYKTTGFTGIEMRDLVLKRNLAQTTHLLMALRTKGITQDLALIAMSWMQLLAGISQPVFQATNLHLPQLYPMA